MEIGLSNRSKLNYYQNLKIQQKDKSSFKTVKKSQSIKIETI